MLPNLINTMQTQQHVTEKSTLIMKYKQDIIGTVFVVEGFFAENVQNISTSNVLNLRFLQTSYLMRPLSFVHFAMIQISEAVDYFL